MLVAKATSWLGMLLSAPLDMMAPRVCLVCGCAIPEGSLCRSCLDSLPLAPAKEEVYLRFTKMAREKVCVSAACALMSFSDDKAYRNIIHGLKYSGIRSIGMEFGAMLASRLISEEMTGYDLVVPLPIHAAKKRERGYNQSDLIAEAIASALGIPAEKNLVKRAVYTRTQTSLGAESRAGNVESIFLPKKNTAARLKGKRVLLADDVITTGATVNSCAEALLIGGAARVDVAAIAAA